MDIDGAALLTELQRPDELTLRFTPHGLGLSVRLSAEGAARFQAASVANAVLADDVPKDVRDNLERACRLHRYGVLEYDFFTAATDYALLVLEGALRVRFVSHYASEIPVIRGDSEETLVASTFDDVRKARNRYKLRVTNRETCELPIGARDLLDPSRARSVTFSRCVFGVV